MSVNQQRAISNKVAMREEKEESHHIEQQQTDSWCSCSQSSNSEHSSSREAKSLPAHEKYERKIFSYWEMKLLKNAAKDHGVNNKEKDERDHITKAEDEVVLLVEKPPPVGTVVATRRRRVDSIDTQDISFTKPHRKLLSYWDMRILQNTTTSSSSCVHGNTPAVVGDHDHDHVAGSNKIDKQSSTKQQEGYRSA